MRSETSGNILCRLTERHWRTTPCGSARRVPVHTEYFYSGGAITLSFIVNEDTDTAGTTPQGKPKGRSGKR